MDESTSAQQLSEISTSWLQQLSPEKRNSNILREACLFVESYPDHEPPPFAQSTLAQGLQMATVLLELNCDNQTIAAAIVYPCVYYHPIAKETVIEKLGKNINKLIAGAQSMETIHRRTQTHTDNLRKMLLAMVDDVRVVLIKLAERVEILKYLQHCTPELQKEIATQAMQIYAPLANRLGIGQLKWLLEDLSFRYLYPQEYKKISQALKMRRTDREHYIDGMKRQLNKLFKMAELENVQTTGRAKHLFSIYRKIKRKQVGVNEIYDTSALRILVPTIKDCYTVLSLVHAHWPPIPQEFDDYIAKPKPNGYRSIHTAVIGAKNINMEIQIRTYKMHEESELGVAAHWRYKENSHHVEGQSIYAEKINLLREVMDWQKEINTEENAAESLYSQIFKDRIYVFSPNGDVYDLINGATPLDFAYHVHTELGHRCRGAKVNDVLVPLSHPLKTGDQVSILTAKNRQPSRDWLNPHLGYLQTSVARAKVRHYFKKLSREEDLNTGHAIWEKIARREGYKKTDLQQIVEKLNYKQVDDLIAGLGAGDIGVAAILQQLKVSKKPIEIGLEAEVLPTRAVKEQPKSSFLTIAGISDLLTQLARCCKPIPGDQIIGYITSGRGITIHQKTCRNIQQASEKRPEKIIEVNWEDTKRQKYPVGLLITAEDRSGLIHDVAAIISNQHISILGLNTRVDTTDNTAYINLTIEIGSLEPLQRIINQLQQISGVISVVRQ